MAIRHQRRKKERKMAWREAAIISVSEEELKTIKASSKRKNGEGEGAQ